MTSSVFPDLNVWLALSTPDHQHFAPAWRWYTALPAETQLVFCRITQLGLLRLLTTRTVMGPATLTQVKAWDVFDRWLREGGAILIPEPPEVDSLFRRRTRAAQASPKDWADAYLAAFAHAAGLTLITFDKALAQKARGSVLLS